MERASYNATAMIEKIRSLTQSCIQELYKTLTNISITVKQVSSAGEIKLFDALIRLLLRLKKVHFNSFSPIPSFFHFPLSLFVGIIK